MKKIKLSVNLFIFFLLFYSSNSFLFSVIIAIYNTGRYLDDSIGSLLNQTIGFENIQIILVNDGSSDNSEEICLRYKEKYIKNIFYIKIEHSGVSKARNIGLKYIRGLYVNFLDADDLWSFNSFKNVFLFFKFNKNVDLVAGRLKFFEAINSYHPLDYKFYKTRVANLTEEYDCIQMSGPSTFFRNSLIKGKKFPENVFTGEDTVFINNILLSNPIIGYLKEAIYYYRRRSDSSSAVQTQSYKVDFYFSQLKFVGQYLIDKSKELYNKIIPFIQFYIGYNDLFRILSPAYIFLKNNELNEYYNIIINQLQQIDDKYILEQKFTHYRTKILALSKKYNRDIRMDIIINNGLLIYSEKILINITKSNYIVIWNFLDIKNNILHLEGKDNFWMPKNKYFYFCKLNDMIYYPKYYDYSGYDFYTMFGLTEKGRMVYFNIPIEQKDYSIFKFFISYEKEIIEIFPSFGDLTHIPPLKNGYYLKDNYIIKLTERRLSIFAYNSSLITYLENQYCIELKKMHKKSVIKLRENYFKNQYLNINFNETEIWLINDKKDRAGDNGEYFFRYLINKNITNIKFYFIIKKGNEDYERLKHFGNIIDLDSKTYLDIFINSDKIISSISDSWISNPYGEEKKYLRDLFHFDIIFLQNEFLIYDLSKYLNRIIKNFSFIIISSKKEYKTILSSQYHYNKNNVKLTGLPRYDNLIELSFTTEKEKLILVAPNWREYIHGTRDLLTDKPIYNNDFNKTNFFKFYNNLINDKDIIYNMEIHNFTGLLCLPPYFSKQILDFKSNKLFKIKTNCHYQQLLIKATIFITDYSNLFFDTAYLKKPIIYYHFDINEYRKYQNPSDGFNYEKNGFGPVCIDIKCIQKEVIKLFINNGKIKKKYLKRINKFFEFSDNNNSDRIFSAIKNKNDKKYSFFFQLKFNNILLIIIFYVIIFKKLL